MRGAYDGTLTVSRQPALYYIANDNAVLLARIVMCSKFLLKIIMNYVRYYEYFDTDSMVTETLLLNSVKLYNKTLCDNLTECLLFALASREKI